MTTILHWHNHDATAKAMEDVSPTLSAAMGEGGAVQTSPLLIIEDEKDGDGFQVHDGRQGARDCVGGTSPTVSCNANIAVMETNDEEFSLLSPEPRMRGVPLRGRREMRGDAGGGARLERAELHTGDGRR